MALDAALLDLDSVTNPLVDVVLRATGGAGYDDEDTAQLIRPARYACLLATAEDCLRVGVNVVLVAPFTTERADEQAWKGVTDRLTTAGGEAHMLFLRISQGELRQRLLTRSAERDLRKLVDLDAYVGSLDLSAPRVPHVTLDAHQSPQAQAKSAIEQLRA